MSSTGMKDVRLSWEGHQGDRRVTLIAFNVTNEEAREVVRGATHGVAGKLLGMLECELNADLYICDSDRPIDEQSNYW